MQPAFEVAPTGRPVGAEIRGVDLSKPLQPETRHALRQAWLTHIVLLFRDQTLDQRAFLEAARVFGTPKVGAARAYYEKAGRSGTMVASELPEVSILSNLDETGNPTERNDSLGSLEVVWHSDNSYVEEPPAGSCLYSVEVPPSTGETSFNNQYVAYETLPDDLKQAIRGRRAKHDATRNSAGVLRPGVTLPTCPAEVPGPFHPLVRLHPETRRPALYLGRRRVWPSQYIEGLDDADSEALLDRLWAHATCEDLAWTHRWRVGDFLVWDNRCALHYRTPVDPKRRRVMYRSQFQGEVPISA